MQKNSLTIIGAGASGLLCSILAARRGISVTLLEQQSKVGRKILASGNGKCNIGNRYPTVDRYHSNDSHFVASILDGYDAEKIIQLFDSLGIAIIEGKEYKLFPMSMQASAVVEILRYEAESLGVQLLTSYRVTAVKKDQKDFIIESDLHPLRKASRLLLACGSMAAPQLGGSSLGLDIASSLGHTIIPSYPSLVQLCSDEKWIKEVSGVKIEAEVQFYANGTYISQKRGDILFTNYGISGLAILDISRDVNSALQEYSYCELHLDLFPDTSKEQLINLFLSYVEKTNTKPIEIWLLGFLNKKLIPRVIAQSKTKAKTVAQLNKKELIKLTYSLKNLKLSISQSRGYQGAEIASGGVETQQINPHTLESKIVPNLYIAGEMLNVDGDRGGFNFHFAWVTAMRVATAL